MTYYFESSRRPQADISVAHEVNKIVIDRWHGHVPGTSEVRRAGTIKPTYAEIMRDPGTYLISRGWRQYKNMNKWISPHDKKYYSTAHAVSIQYHLEEDSTL